MCPMGYYCVANSLLTHVITPVACPVGTYSNRAGLQALVNSGSTRGCLTCPAGYFCPSTSMTTPTPCGVGYYSAAGATACTICPIGSYCSSTTTITPVSCGAGFLCTTEGMKIAPFHISINSCLPGYWCASNAANACPKGTYQPLYGASASTACITTPAGFFNDQGSFHIILLKQMSFWNVLPCW